MSTPFIEDPEDEDCEEYSGEEDLDDYLTWGCGE